MGLVTAKQIAVRHGITPGSWRVYVATQGAPGAVERHGPTAMYDEDAVEAWFRDRPGQGFRSDLRQTREEG